MAWYNKGSAVAGLAVYCDGQQVAKNGTVTFPEVNDVTAEVQAGGTNDVPISGQTEALELSITKDTFENLAPMLTKEYHTIEVRGAQDVVISQGMEKVVRPFKAFFRAIPKNIPGFERTTGEIPEDEITFSVSRYQLLDNNIEVFLIDKWNGVYKVNGRDYGTDVEKYL